VCQEECAEASERSLGEFPIPPMNQKEQVRCACGLGLVDWSLLLNCWPTCKMLLLALPVVLVLVGRKKFGGKRGTGCFNLGLKILTRCSSTLNA
jgi:hypothetical protein